MQLESLGTVFSSIASLRLDLLSQLQSLIALAEDVAAREAHRAEKLRESLGAEVRALEVQLEQKEEMLQAKEADLTQLKENLGAKIQELEERLRHEEKLLEARDGHLKQLESEMEAMARRVFAMQSVVEQAKEVAAGAAERVERPGESPKDTVSTLELQLREKEKALRAKDAALKELKESLSARVQELESQGREKDQLIRVLYDQKLRSSQLVQAKDEQINKLMSELLVAKVTLTKTLSDGGRSKRGWKFRFKSGRSQTRVQAEKFIDGDDGRSGKPSYEEPLSDAHSPAPEQPNQRHSLVLAFKRYFCF